MSFFAKKRKNLEKIYKWRERLQWLTETVRLRRLDLERLRLSRSRDFGRLELQ